MFILPAGVLQGGTGRCSCCSAEEWVAAMFLFSERLGVARNAFASVTLLARYGPVSGKTASDANALRGVYLLSRGLSRSNNIVMEYFKMQCEVSSL